METVFFGSVTVKLNQLFLGYIVLIVSSHVVNVVYTSGYGEERVFLILLYLSVMCGILLDLK
jgi:hypothetical protein